MSTIAHKCEAAASPEATESLFLDMCDTVGAFLNCRVLYPGSELSSPPVLRCACDPSRVHASRQPRGRWFTVWTSVTPQVRPGPSELFCRQQLLTPVSLRI